MLMLHLKVNKIIIYLTLFVILIVTILMFTVISKQNKNLTPEQYLKNLKYDIEYIGETEITIPQTFNQILKEYNNLQKEQGFDLSKYCGKKCIKKRFAISSPKSKSQKYFADMIVCEEKLIGGHIHTKIYNQPPMKINSIS